MPRYGSPLTLRNNDMGKKPIEVTEAELISILRGEPVLRGLLRRTLTLDDGPFVLRVETQPDYNKDTIADIALKPDRPDFESKKGRFNKKHHIPFAQLEFLPSIHWRKELNDMPAEDWPFPASDVLGAVLHKDALKREVEEVLVGNKLEELWMRSGSYLAIPIPPIQLVQLGNQGIGDLMRELAEQQIEPGEFSENTPDGRMMYVGRNIENEIVAIMMIVSRDRRYSEGIASAVAKATLRPFEDDRAPMIDELRVSKFAELKWLLTKRHNAGYATQMMKQAFQFADYKGHGLVLRFPRKTYDFFRRFEPIMMKNRIAVWTPEKVSALAKETKVGVAAEEDGDKFVWAIDDLQIEEGGATGTVSEGVEDEEAPATGTVSEEETLEARGGPGSGHRGHRGRLGEVGGSLPSAGTVKIRKLIPSKELTTRQLIQRIKAQFGGSDPQTLYGRFVRERALKPEIDNKTFQKIFAEVEPDLYEIEDVVGVEFTHYDALMDEKVFIYEDDNGVLQMIWEKGMTGSQPFPLDPDRFSALTERALVQREDLSEVMIGDKITEELPDYEIAGGVYTNPVDWSLLPRNWARKITIEEGHDYISEDDQAILDSRDPLKTGQLDGFLAPFGDSIAGIERHASPIHPGTGSDQSVHDPRKKDHSKPLSDSAEKHTAELAKIGIKPGDRFTDYSGQIWQYTRANYTGVPYFVKVNKGRVGKTEFVIPQFKREFAKRLAEGKSEPANTLESVRSSIKASGIKGFRVKREGGIYAGYWAVIRPASGGFSEEQAEFLRQTLGGDVQAGDPNFQIKLTKRHGDHVDQEGRSPEAGGSKPGYTHADGGAEGEEGAEGEAKETAVEFPEELQITEEQKVEAETAAKDLYQTAVDDEPALTSMMEELAKKFGGKLKGLEFRIKTEESLAGKILRGMVQKGLSLKEAIYQSTYDANRYTLTFDPKTMVDDALQLQSELAQRGWKEYDHKWTNYYRAGDAYDGYNMVFIHGKTGKRFELQLHTQESYEIKNRVWPSYKEFRDPATPEEKRASLFQRMVAEWKNYTKPIGWEKLPGVVKSERPVAGVRYFARIIDDPDSPRYKERVSLHRWEHSEAGIRTEWWDTREKKWVNDPDLIGFTGIGGGNDYEEITLRQAHELFREFEKRPQPEKPEELEKKGLLTAVRRSLDKLISEITKTVRGN